ncbi:MAG: 16S rRNA (guanine(966)-N(2))-methyltransferase RsmD [Anaerolineales bacterium]|nr:16S rRNA (guanine(966)-N(2))-methyltransferase RsmD [Anaerolineales bacterium]
MSLRVISGAAKGRKLKSVPGDTTRPITDMVKEALFNIIGADVVDSSWWDLFAGTGAVGIEALSRGASFVRFTDLNRAPIETIKFNLEHCRLAERAEVRRADSLAALTQPADRQFQNIYVAPPQYKGIWERALLALDENPSWLTEDAWVMAQIAPREYKDLELQNLVQFDERKYSNTLLAFYELQEK